MAGPEGSRSRRVAELIRRELAPVLQGMARDLGAGLLSLTVVDISPDLRQARIGVTRLGGTATDAALLDSLRAQAGEMRTQLAHALDLRTVPRLSFVLDDTLAKDARLAALLKGQAVDGMEGS